MAAFNFFSHGTQDMYPTFLKEQHGFGNEVESLIAIVYNFAAILGRILAGALSQKFGRRWVMIVMALLVLPAISLWAYSHTAVMLGIGAFIVQFMVQGAWGVIPACLNELMPLSARAMLTGFVDQVGNVIASPNSTLQAGWAERLGGNFSLPVSAIAGSVAVIIAVLVFFGKEARGKSIEGER
jgi:SHS family lactate transporter-like MFS transporter